MALTTSQKYARRRQKVIAAHRTVRSGVRSFLRLGMQQGTQTQLYDRTTLPVTRAMFRAIGTMSDSISIAVGFSTPMAPHIPIRLKKEGRSVSDGHDMTLNLAEFIRQVYGDKILRYAHGAYREALR